MKGIFVKYANASKPLRISFQPSRPFSHFPRIVGAQKRSLSLLPPLESIAGTVDFQHGGCPVFLRNQAAEYNTQIRLGGAKQRSKNLPPHPLNFR